MNAVAVWEEVKISDRITLCGWRQPGEASLQDQLDEDAAINARVERELAAERELAELLGRAQRAAVEQVVAWAEWHLARAEARRLPATAAGPVALHAVVDRAYDLLAAAQDDADDGTILALVQALHHAVDRAECAAEADRQHQLAPWLEQAEEVAAGGMRRWTWQFEQLRGLPEEREAGASIALAAVELLMWPIEWAPVEDQQ
jgi:hypothetical protein